MKITAAILLTLCAHLALGANILGVFPFAGKSHYMAGATLMRVLAEAGHNVTMISLYGEKEPPKNYRDVVIEQDVIDRDLKINLSEMEDHNTIMMLLFSVQMTSWLKDVMGSTVFQNFVAENPKFDVVIVEQFFTNDIFKFLAWKFNAHLVLFSAVDASYWTNHFVSNPAPPSYIPDLTTSYTSDMNFLQRAFNLVIYTSHVYLLHEFILPDVDKIVQEYYPDAPSIKSIAFNNSLIFLNGELSVGSPLPKVPNMIDIGGYHINPPEELPTDLKMLLDRSKNGVVYFSMGSNLNTKDITKEQKDIFFRVFSKLNQDVLWKFEDETIENLPKNVHVSKWLPQQDILAHKNVKLFITHGGIFSTMEAVYHGVPLFIIPVFGDQKMNAEKCRQNGFALVNSIKELNEHDFEIKIKELLNNPIYKQNVQKKSMIMKDQIVTPRDKLKFWIDYVIRHEGAYHLQVAGINLNWYQYLSLDVIVFLLFCIAVSSTLLIIIIRALIQFCFASRKKSKHE